MTNIEKFFKEHKSNAFSHESGIVRRLDDFESLLNCSFCPVTNKCKIYNAPEDCIVAFMKWAVEESDEEY